MTTSLRDYGFILLGKRELSVSVLRDKLISRAQKNELDDSEVESVVDEFIQKGWVSDERFCEGYIRDQILKRNGPIKIQFNARKYGLSKDLVSQKMEMLYDEDSQLEVLKELIENKTHRIKKRDKKISNYELKSKLMSYLSGKGFTYDLIKTTCGEFF